MQRAYQPSELFVQSEELSHVASEIVRPGKRRGALNTLITTIISRLLLLLLLLYCLILNINCYETGKMSQAGFEPATFLEHT